MRQDSSGIQLRSADLTKCLREGATLSMNFVDRVYAPLRTMVQGLEAALRVPVWANLYASWRVTPAFDLHWDDHDAFILQVSGEKHWQVYGPTRRFPIQDSVGAAPPCTQAVWEGVLRAGDCLYLPRGWWHKATPVDVPTLHLTVGFKNITGIDFCQWLLGCLRSEECLRMDLPRFQDRDVQADYVSRIRERISQAFADPSILTRFVQNLAGTIASRSTFGFPHTAMTDRSLEAHRCSIWMTTRFPLEIQEMEGQEEVGVTIEGKTVTFEPYARPILNYLIRNVPVAVSEYCSYFEDRIDRATLLLVLGKLVDHGIVTLKAAKEDLASPLDFVGG
jgi:hypothetical protein